MPDCDWDAEGFNWFWGREAQRAWDDGLDGPTSEFADRVSWDEFEDWRAAGGSSWVVRFEILELLSMKEAA